MIILEITDVQEFDVLLTSGDAKFSGAIKKLQSVFRWGRSAPFSHASLLLSPFSVIESLDTSGIVITDLFKPSTNPHGQEKKFDDDQTQIVARIDGARLRLFAILNGVNRAEVRRYRPISSCDPAKFAQSKNAILAAISAVYLAEYPAYARLLATARVIPNEVVNALERIGMFIENKTITGPFCSELVVNLLGCAHPMIMETYQTAKKTAPSDLSHNKEIFELVTIAKEYSSPEELPGRNSKDFIDIIQKYLSIKSNASQKFNSDLVKLTRKLPNAIGIISNIRQSEFVAVTELYQEILDTMRQDWIKPLSDHIQTSRRLGIWLRSANKCAASCPAERKAPASSPGGKPRLQPAWEHRGPSEERCIDVRYCSGIEPRWDRLSIFLEEQHEERMQRDFKRASQRVDSMRRDQI